jgi:hypothetical protein
LGYQDDVTWLKITVDNTHLVCGLHPPSDLCYQWERFCSSELAMPPDELRERFAHKQFHAHENEVMGGITVQILVPEKIKSPANIWMGNLFGQMNFALKSLHCV